MCWERAQHLQHWLHPNEHLVFQPTPVGSVHVDSGTSAVTRDSHVHRDQPSQQALRNQVRCSQLLWQCHVVWHLSEFLLDQRSSKPHAVRGGWGWFLPRSWQAQFLLNLEIAIWAEFCQSNRLLKYCIGQWNSLGSWTKWSIIWNGSFFCSLWVSCLSQLSSLVRLPDLPGQQRSFGSFYSEHVDHGIDQQLWWWQPTPRCPLPMDRAAAIRMCVSHVRAIDPSQGVQFMAWVLQSITDCQGRVPWGGWASWSGWTASFWIWISPFFPF